MTKLLEQAFTRAGSLPEPEQDAIAQMLMDEIESDRLWELAFDKSPEKLLKLADKAWSDHEDGRSEPLDLDKL